MIVIAITTLASAVVLALPRSNETAAAQPDRSGDSAGSPGGGAGATADPNGLGSADAVDPYHRPGWIEAENAKPGTADWHIPDDPKMWEKVRGYANVTSVDHGGSFTLYVESPGAPWHVEAYRMGFYGGTGGRLIWTSPPQPPVRQSPPVIDRTTNMREAQWTPVLDVTTDASWPPGQYLLKLVSDNGGATFIPLVVRDDDSPAPLLMQSSVTTWQAYNDWGGSNLYTGVGGRAKVVTFDRPYNGNGSGEFLGREFELIYFIERLGLDVTYWTDIDLHERGELLQWRKAIVMGGHDEYYSTSMRRALEAARDAGVNLAFLGANNVYRKIRLEPSPLGPSRREVNYRDPTSDPMRGVDNSEVTVEWRAAPSNEPESSLTGSYYECNPVKADMVISDASAWIFEGTGVANGDRWPNAVGNEYDRVTPGVPTPANIQILAHSPVTCKGKRSFADMTYYTAPSGAGVFTAGTFWLIPALDDACLTGPTEGPSCQIQKMVENLLRTFSAGPAGIDHPSVPNAEKFGIKVTPPKS